MRLNNGSRLILNRSFVAGSLRGHLEQEVGHLLAW